MKQWIKMVFLHHGATLYFLLSKFQTTCYSAYIIAKILVVLSFCFLLPRLSLYTYVYISLVNGLDLSRFFQIFSVHMVSKIQVNQGICCGIYIYTHTNKKLSETIIYSSFFIFAFWDPLCKTHRLFRQLTYLSLFLIVLCTLT